MEFRNIQLPIEPEEPDLINLQDYFLERIDVLSQEFAIFKQNAKKVLKLTVETFGQKLDTDPVSLQEELIRNMSIFYTLGQMSADSKTFQQIYEILHYCPKKPKYSELDRKRYTDIKTIQQANLLAQLRNGEEKMEKRITVIQSVLKAEVTRMQKDSIN